MKAVFVCNPHYFRRINSTGATVLEMGDTLSSGDVLWDVVTGQEVAVIERGFRPTRSPQTTCRLQWSREVTATFEGDCRAFEGRLLFAGDVSGLQCVVVKGHISEKSGPLPIETPIVGAVRLDAYDCPGLLKFNDAMETELIFLAKIETDIRNETLDYLCVSPDLSTVQVCVSVSAVKSAADVGKLLDWHEEDAPVLMC